ncbi:MAG: hypothetical protein QXD66_07245 [Candidatus Nezhaarchaeales archaeon]|nr:MAG: hypothetical protein DSO06_05500 [Candidatus Nezhaarchaeota archaeon WYZ-LMO8]TDA35467.1 MAG: hypothetical protein DSO05_05275 [Candidatus Nezhaarchaeota archaeon WYZ-LMO7]
MELKNIVKLIFKLSEVEGEDLPLKHLLSAFNIEVPRELKPYEDLPPRIALSLIYKIEGMRNLLREVSSELIKEKCTIKHCH